MAGDYFSALMRASGMQPAVVASAAIADPGPLTADSGIVELHEEQMAPELLQQSPLPAAPPVPAAAISAQAGAPTADPGRKAVPQGHAPDPAQAQLPRTASRTQAGQATDSATPLQQSNPVEPPRPVVSEPPPAAPSDDMPHRPVAASNAVGRQALLRVALNWVSNGPRFAEPARQFPVDHDSQPTPADSGSAVQDVVQPVIASAVAVPARHALLPSTTHADSPHPVPPQWSAPRDARAAASQQAVQVTIGSIHLRVDAPPPMLQAAAAPAPAPPAARTPARVRGDLERRLLRRL